VITQLLAARLVASGVTVTPNSTAIPGINTLSTLVGSLMPLAWCYRLLVRGVCDRHGDWAPQRQSAVVDEREVGADGVSRRGPADRWLDLLINTFYGLGTSLS